MNEKDLNIGSDHGGRKESLVVCTSHNNGVVMKGKE